MTGLRRSVLSESAANLLRDRILSGAYPPGSRLSEQALSKELEVSRGPIREALAELRGEGLVLKSTGRPGFVVDVGLQGLAERYQVRAGLEIAACILIVDAGQSSSIRALRRQATKLAKAVETGNPTQFVEADLGLHRAICQHSGNRLLLNVWEKETGLLRSLVRRESGAELDFADEILASHSALVDAVEARDIDRIVHCVWALFSEANSILAKQLHASLDLG